MAIGFMSFGGMLTGGDDAAETTEVAVADPIIEMSNNEASETVLTGAEPEVNETIE